MESVVEAVKSSITGCEIIPMVRKSYPIAIRQVEPEANIGTGTRKKDASGFIGAKNCVHQVDVGGIVVHIRKTWIIHDTNKWQSQLNKRGQ